MYENIGIVGEKLSLSGYLPMAGVAEAGTINVTARMMRARVNEMIFFIKKPPEINIFLL